jgi:hypothetical protein
MNQHDFVVSCKSRYLCNPPLGYHFEKAHYPLSEKLGGTETVRLWYPDHIVQGCIQTLELCYPCIDTRKEHIERPIVNEVYPEYADLYKEAYTFCKRYSGTRRGEVAFELGLGFHDPEVRKNSNETYRKNGVKARDEKLGLFDPKHQERIKKIRSEATTKTNKQKWKSTVDGFISNAAAVAHHNKANGWDPLARVKLEQHD